MYNFCWIMYDFVEFYTSQSPFNAHHNYKNEYLVNIFFTHVVKFVETERKLHGVETVTKIIFLHFSFIY